MFWHKISKGARELGEYMISNPEDWTQTDYYFQCLSSKDIRLWTVSGASYIKLNGNEAFNHTEKLYLNDCIKKSIVNKLNSINNKRIK